MNEVSLIQASIEQLERVSRSIASIGETEDYTEFAIDALEKQVPKKIVYYKQSYGTPYRCPECGADQIAIDFFNSDGTEPSEKYSWCWKCGQKLDWGDAE